MTSEKKWEGVDVEEVNSLLSSIRDNAGSMAYAPPEGMILHQREAAESMNLLARALGLDLGPDNPEVRPASRVALSTCVSHALLPAREQFARVVRERHPVDQRFWTDISGSTAAEAYGRGDLDQRAFELFVVLGRAGVGDLDDVRQGELVSCERCCVCSHFAGWTSHALRS